MPVVGLEFLLPGARFLVPIGVLALHIGQDSEVENRRRRSGGPFQRAAVPGIAGAVAQFRAAADADDELRDLKDDVIVMRTAPKAAMISQGRHSATS